MEEYVVRTTVDRRAMTALAMAARKTLRRRRSRLVHTFGMAVTAVMLVLALGNWMIGDRTWWLNLALALLMLVVTASEDTVNGLAGLRQVQPGSREVTAEFTGEHYVHQTGTAVSLWQYDKVQAVCETGEYFILLLDSRHGQVYAKEGFTRGTPMAFRDFISRKTGKLIVYL